MHNNRQEGADQGQSAEVHQPVRDMALRSGLANEFNRSQVFPTVDVTVQDYLKALSRAALLAMQIDYRVLSTRSPTDVCSIVINS